MGTLFEEQSAISRAAVSPFSIHPALCSMTTSSHVTMNCEASYLHFCCSFFTKYPMRECVQQKGSFFVDTWQQRKPGHCRRHKDETVAEQNATSAVLHEKTHLSALHVPTTCPTSVGCSVRTGSWYPGVGVGWRHHPPRSSNAE